MEELRRHNLSNPFGEASDTDFNELVQSMMERGYDENHPIWLFQGAILDGYHRNKAAKQLNLMPIYREFEGTYQDAEAFVWAENMARRQMTPKQKAAAFVHRNTELPAKRQISATEIAARSGHTSSEVVRQLTRVAEAAPDKLQAVAYPGE